VHIQSVLKSTIVSPHLTTESSELEQFTLFNEQTIFLFFSTPQVEIFGSENKSVHLLSILIFLQNVTEMMVQ